MKNKIKEYREMQGFTAVHLAEMVGVSSQSLANNENGTQIPNVKTALKLAKFLKIPVTELFILK